MRDVAAKAGVSQTLVSFYVSGRRVVNPETARRIQAAIEDLDYHPNGAARNLRLKRSNVVAVMVPFLTNPSFAIMASAAEAALAKEQFLTLVCSTGGSPDRRKTYFDAIRATRAAGLLVFPSVDIAEPIRKIAGSGIPVVLMERDLPSTSKGSPIDAVIVDSSSGIREATGHLLDLGHTRIGLLNMPRESMSSAQRADGYREAFWERGRMIDEELIVWQTATVQEGHDGIPQLLNQANPSTAVVVTTNLQTVGALVAIRERGLTMPEDLSVVGFGHPGFEFWPATPLTVITHDAAAVGRLAAELLISRLRGEEADGPRRIILQTRLEIQASTGPLGVRSTVPRSPHPSRDTV